MFYIFDSKIVNVDRRTVKFHFVTIKHVFMLFKLQTQLNVAGLALIGSARLSRSHFQIKNLLNSYRAGVHCYLITLDVSARGKIGDKKFEINVYSTFLSFQFNTVPF